MRNALCGITVVMVVGIAGTSTSTAFDPSNGLNGVNVGTLGGAVVGGVGGNYLAKKAKIRGAGRTIATIGGTIAGGYLGNILGRNLDARSRERATYAHHNAVVTGQPQRWQGQAGSRSYGSVQPGHPYRTSTGICRDYIHTVTIDRRSETVRGIACRNPDGTWRDAS